MKSAPIKHLACIIVLFIFTIIPLCVDDSLLSSIFSPTEIVPASFGCACLFFSWLFLMSLFLFLFSLSLMQASLMVYGIGSLRSAYNSTPFYMQAWECEYILGCVRLPLQVVSSTHFPQLHAVIGWKSHGLSLKCSFPNTFIMAAYLSELLSLTAAIIVQSWLIPACQIKLANMQPQTLQWFIPAQTHFTLATSGHSFLFCDIICEENVRWLARVASCLRSALTKWLAQSITLDSSSGNISLNDLLLLLSAPCQLTSTNPPLPLISWKQTQANIPLHWLGCALIQFLLFWYFLLVDTNVVLTGWHLLGHFWNDIKIEDYRGQLHKWFGFVLTLTW